MRFRLILIAFFISLTASTFAQEVVATSGLRSKYLGAQGGLFADKSVSQSTLCGSWKNGIFTCGWFSTGFNTKPGPDGKDYAVEFDAAGGKVGTRGRMSYAVDAQYFVVRGGDVANLNGRVAFGTLFAKIEAYAPVTKGGPRKGLIISTGLEVSDAQLGRFKRLRGTLGQWVKHDSGAFGFDKNWLYQANVGLKFLATKNLGIGTGMRFSKPFKETQDGRKTETAWELLTVYYKVK